MGCESWRPVVGSGGIYEVSDQGRVRSLDHKSRYVNRHGTEVYCTKRGQVLRPGRASNGYLTVCVAQNGRRVSVPVQWLVAAAFIGPRPEGLIICHNDGNKENNVVSNLRYDTYRANLEDADRHGHRVRGEGYANAKLTDDRVRQIRRESWKSLSTLAAELNVSPAAIQAVRDRRTWTHVL